MTASGHGQCRDGLTPNAAVLKKTNRLKKPLPYTAGATPWSCTCVVAANAAPVPATRKVLWTWDAGDAIESSAAIAGDLVFVGAATGELVALNLSDGKKRWTYKTTKPIGESSPAVANGLVFIGDLGGVVHAVKVADGTAAWTHKTEGEIKSSPVTLGDRVLIGSYDGSLYCLSAKDGKVLWSLKTENYVHGTPAVDDTRRIWRDATKCSGPCGSAMDSRCSRCRSARTPARRWRCSRTRRSSARSTTK